MKIGIGRWLSALVFAASLSGTATAQDRTKITIGMTVSSTGTFALASQSGDRGVRIWLDDVNSRGGIELGGKKYPVELEQLDDRSDKQMVPRVYETLIQEKKVDLLMAPFGSTLTGAAATITERSNKAMVAWSASSDGIYKQGHSKLISAVVMASRIPEPSIDLAKKLGADKVAIVYVDEPFPADMANSAKEYAEKIGSKVVLFERHAKGAKDFSVILEKAKAAGATALIVTSYEADDILMTRQMKERDINFPFTFMIYASTPQFLAIGKDSQYIFSHTQFHEGANWKISDGLPQDKFLAAYKRLFPNVAYPADFQTALAYGAGVVMEKMITTANSLDADKLKQAALDISGKTTVLTGPFAIDSTGTQTGMSAIVLQAQPNGVFAVAPEAVANGKPVFPTPEWSKR